MAVESGVHSETNESGVSMQHPGYVEITCPVCGRLNIRSKSFHYGAAAPGECLGVHRSKDVGKL